MKLRTANEAQLISLLPMFRRENKWLTDYGDSSLVVIGTIYTGGTYDEYGEVITPPVALEGFHVNLINRDGIEIPEQYLVNPKNPQYEWF